MLGDQLHNFDVKLCEYAGNNIRGNMGRPNFADYAKEHIDAPVLDYLMALGEDEPEPLLLNDQELTALFDAFEGGPLEFDRPWAPYEPLHRQHVDCVAEVRVALASEYAEEWARISAQMVKRLEDEGTRLSDGVQAVHEWIAEVRRLLRAMGAVSLLPCPQGAFPTPGCPEPSSAEPGEAPIAEGIKDGHDRLVDRITRMEALQIEMRDLLLHQRTIKDYYTTAEVATMLGKAEFTCREWCRLGRVRGEKQGSGRGKYQAWVISHEELQRLQREGLLPVHRS